MISRDPDGYPIRYYTYGNPYPQYVTYISIEIDGVDMTGNYLYFASYEDALEFNNWRAIDEG